MDVKIIPDSQLFLKHVENDIREASKRVLIQTLSFEGDRAGRKVSALLRLAGVPDKRIIVDSYTRWCLSDHILFLPHNWLRVKLWREWISTRRMFQHLKACGYMIRFVHPPGPSIRKMANRNHKKLVIIDDVCYVGGINLCDHNFQWLDMMVRIEDTAISDFFAMDFDMTWEGQNQLCHRKFHDMEVRVLDGYRNEAALAPVLQQIRSARSSIYVMCPYITSPFLDAVFEAGKRGVRIVLFTPRNNNRGFLRRYIQYMVKKARREVPNLTLLFFPDRMVHTKAILIDEAILLFGSANFDFMCYRVQPEYVMVSRNRALISAFLDTMWYPALAVSRTQADEINGLWGSLSVKMIQWFDRLVTGHDGEARSRQAIIGG